MGAVSQQGVGVQFNAELAQWSSGTSARADSWTRKSPARKMLQLRMCADRRAASAPGQTALCTVRYSSRRSGSRRVVWAIRFTGLPSLGVGRRVARCREAPRRRQRPDRA
jgi:hypothetical protein